MTENPEVGLKCVIFQVQTYFSYDTATVDSLSFQYLGLDDL